MTKKQLLRKQKQRKEKRKIKNIAIIIFSIIVVITLLKSCSCAFDKEYENNMIKNQKHIQELKNNGLLPIDY